MGKNIYVINSFGQKEPLSFNKVFKSARRVGASKHLADQIANQIFKEAYPGIPTKEIYKKVQKLLYQETPLAAIRFSLKEGIRKLGPSGFPFEKYISAIFQSHGYLSQCNQLIPGKCITHEIDFIAHKDTKLYIGECKYHSLGGNRVDLKVVLSDYARYLDLQEGKFFEKGSLKDLKIIKIVVTNTKFTAEAVKYANCAGLTLLGWRYPKDQGLEYMIESKKLYPITILPSVSVSILEAFSQEKIMLVPDLLKLDPVRLARRLNLPERKVRDIFSEAELLTSGNYK